MMSSLGFASYILDCVPEDLETWKHQPVQEKKLKIPLKSLLSLVKVRKGTAKQYRKKTAALHSHLARKDKVKNLHFHPCQVVTRHTNPTPRVVLEKIQWEENGELGGKELSLPSMMSVQTTWEARTTTPTGKGTPSTPCKDGVRKGLVENQNFHYHPHDVSGDNVGSSNEVLSSL